MRRIAISLGEEELIWLKRILADEDREEALRFIREVLERKVKEAELPHCVPVFEESYRPNQGEIVTGRKAADRGGSGA
ncbi:hypothetical protein [Candidatus Solincola sp.]|jgi:hypothetical protein|nr:hypothetical protein [Actinomycetota bacterium]MDI7253073.1 hypothetical protein [Actinomycetota bacterium]